MRNRIVGIWIALLAVGCLSTGCGGGSGGQSSRKGRAVFTVKWPAPSRLIPAAANSIKVSIQRNGTDVQPPQVIARPDTSITFNDLPIDSLNVTASAFPTTDGTGIAQATGNAVLVTQGDQTVTIVLTMNTTITDLRLGTTSTTLGRGRTRDLTAIARNATGDVVLVSQGTLQWSSTNQAVATVSGTGTTGVVSGLSNGTTTVKVTETESNKQASIDMRVSGGLAASPWPRFHGDNSNRGLSNAVGPGVTPSPSIRWSAPTNGAVSQGPVLGANGWLYVATDTGFVHAIDQVTGAIKWTFNLLGLAGSSPAVGSDGTVYASSLVGRVVGLNGTTGTLIWERQLNSAIRTSPVITDSGLVCVGTQNGFVFALDGWTGADAWQFQTQTAVNAAMALNSSGILYVSTGNNVLRLNAADGRIVSGVQLTSATLSSPAIGLDGTVYIGGSDRVVWALDPVSLSVKWTQTVNGAVALAAPAIGPDGTVVVKDDTGEVIALDRQSGNVIWVGSPVPTGGISPAIDSAGSVFIQVFTELASLNDGSPLWTLPITANMSSPAIGSDGTIYFGQADSKVVAVR